MDDEEAAWKLDRQRSLSEAVDRLSRATVARSSPLPGWLLAASLVALWGVLRLVVFKGQTIPLTYVLPLLVCVWTRSRRMLVAMAAIFAVMAFTETLVFGPAIPDNLLRFVATMVNIAVGALVVYAIMRLRERLEGSLADVTAANVRVQSQSEELAAQNEELVTQADELDALNSEIGQRAKVLAALLEATRRREDRRSVLERVCAACVEVMGEPAVLAAVSTRQGESMLLESAAGRDGAGRPLDAFAYSAASFEELGARGGAGHLAGRRRIASGPEPAARGRHVVLVGSLRALPSGGKARRRALRLRPARPPVDHRAVRPHGVARRPVRPGHREHAAAGEPARERARAA